MESGKDGIETLAAIAKHLKSPSVSKFVSLADVLLTDILRSKIKQQQAQSMMSRRTRQSTLSATRLKVNFEVKL